MSLPLPLDAVQRARLKTRAAAGESIAIVVLGGGIDPMAPEYGSADLASASLMRLRYAVWLGRETDLPICASGGVGWVAADPAMQSEAHRMAEIAQAEYGTRLRWIETTSRDTHENALNTLALLQPAGVREVVLVTHATHMPRALREFRAAARAAASAPVRLTPAPMGQAWPGMSPLLRWLPSSEGTARVRAALHEVLARLGDSR